MADFFRHKNQHDVLIQFAQFLVGCPHPICIIFGRFIECMLVVISSEKYIDFWH